MYAHWDTANMVARKYNMYLLITAQHIHVWFIFVVASSGGDDATLIAVVTVRPTVNNFGACNVVSIKEHWFMMCDMQHHTVFMAVFTKSRSLDNKFQWYIIVIVHNMYVHVCTCTKLLYLLKPILKIIREMGKSVSFIPAFQSSKPCTFLYLCPRLPRNNLRTSK